MTRLEQQIQFIREIDKVKNIYRQTYLADGRRKENDAEHSWHIALMAVLLQEYVPYADAARVMTMVLIHDLVEIDAGDTYAYDSAGAETKRVREAAAADRIFGLLPEEQQIPLPRRQQVLLREDVSLPVSSPQSIRLPSLLCPVRPTRHPYR